MRKTTSTPTLTIGELEASFPLYLKMLRILIRERKTLEQIQRTICWSRINSLHQVLPETYQDPGQLYINLQRDIYT